MAANSAQQRAPVIVRTPAIAQEASSHPVEPTIVIDLAETMKMPDPIIDPMTIIVASNMLRPRTSPGLSTGAIDAGCAGAFAEAMTTLLHRRGICYRTGSGMH